MRPQRFSPLTARVREVRRELYGEGGAPVLAEALGLSVRTWQDFEMGVTIPATVILRFIDLTGVDPSWLLTGQGEARPRPPARRTVRHEGPPPWVAGA
jgi:hypothetical protein